MTPYRHCNRCDVHWRGIAPCFVCGQQGESATPLYLRTPHEYIVGGQGQDSLARLLIDRGAA